MAKVTPVELILKIEYADNCAETILSNCFSNLLGEKTLLVCIGTDKCIGDCLGPLIGTILEKNGFPYPIIGSLDFPAHAMNLEEVLKKIELEYPEHFIIAIDACLGFGDCIGQIQVKRGPVHPGKGVGKKLPLIGDISVVGVVDSMENSDIFSMRNIRLNFILKMAEVIARSLLKASKNNDNINTLSLV